MSGRDATHLVEDALGGGSRIRGRRDGTSDDQRIRPGRERLSRRRDAALIVRREAAPARSRGPDPRADDPQPPAEPPAQRSSLLRRGDHPVAAGVPRGLREACGLRRHRILVIIPHAREHGHAQDKRPGPAASSGLVPGSSDRRLQHRRSPRRVHRQEGDPMPDGGPAAQLHRRGDVKKLQIQHHAKSERAHPLDRHRPARGKERAADLHDRRHPAQPAGHGQRRGQGGEVERDDQPIRRRPFKVQGSRLSVQGRFPETSRASRCLYPCISTLEPAVRLMAPRISSSERMRCRAQYRSRPRAIRAAARGSAK